MPKPRPKAAETFSAYLVDFIRRQVDAVSEPNVAAAVLRRPPERFHVVERFQAELLQTKLFLVERFGHVRVETYNKYDP